ncbi:MAG: tetraacyldisaccharide 4'-kinase [Bacteroidales bacterium]|nr:tetraacyldisaccharide 4'-kinase [Bacteroidales bacterium]
MYWLITYIRNLLFNKGLLRSYSFADVFVLCVGNLRVGGTGKTPMVEYLIRNLHKEYNLAVLSLGYKRQTKGLKEITSADDYKSVGDEPKQMSEKFPDVRFFVNKDRNQAIEYIKQKYPSTQLIILDDAYQYRKTKPAKTILLTEYHRPFYSDFVLPYGRLRERRKEKRRADYIVVTKSPNEISVKDRQIIISSIKPLSNQQIFFSSIQYNEDLQSELMGKDVALLVGIDNPQPLISYLNTFCKVKQVLKFPDHHSFSEKETQMISKIKYPIITTEKDYSRLKDFNKKLYVQKIELEVDNSFLNMLKRDIEDFIL